MKHKVRPVGIEILGPSKKTLLKLECAPGVTFYEFGTGKRFRLVPERSVVFPMGTKKLLKDLASLPYPEEDDDQESREVRLLKGFSIRARSILENAEREKR